MTSLPYSASLVYHKRIGLLFLLAYALDHPHSAQWIGPLTRLLAQEVTRHG
jgi:hypothetical protein